MASVCLVSLCALPGQATDKSIAKQSPVSSSSSNIPSGCGDNHSSVSHPHCCSVLLTGIMLRKWSPLLSQDSVSTGPRLPGPAGLTLASGLPGTDWPLRPDQRVRAEAATGAQNGGEEEEWLHTRHHLTLHHGETMTLHFNVNCWVKRFVLCM